MVIDTDKLILRFTRKGKGTGAAEKHFAEDWLRRHRTQCSGSLPRYGGQDSVLLATDKRLTARTQPSTPS